MLGGYESRAGQTTWGFPKACALHASDLAPFQSIWRLYSPHTCLFEDPPVIGLKRG